MATGIATALAALAGLAGATQVAVNGRLGERIGVLPAFTFSVLVSALIASTALLLVRRSADGLADALRQPPWLWLGGVMGVVIVFGITAAGGSIGTTATIGVLICCQLVMGAVIDWFGLFGLSRIPLHASRVAGLLLLGAGAALTLRR